MSVPSLAGPVLGVASATSSCFCLNLSWSSVAVCQLSPGRVEAPSHSCLSFQVDQSGLGLPSRDYYLNKTENEKVSGPLQRE